MVAHPATILIADHDARIRHLLRAGLVRRGYRCVQAGSGHETVRRCREDPPDALILELDLPGRDGFAVIRAVRDVAPTPILVLSARGEVDQKVKALELGAADYITKPFHMEELLARLKVALRHGLQVTGEAPVFRSGTLAVDLVSRHVSRNGVEVHLTRLEYKILRCLVANAGRAVTHQQLCREVWGPRPLGNIPYLRELISQLRQKIDSGAGGGRVLATEPGVGYRLLVI
jgi:two-component system, OmpR family, KDP operon response regulator KdpE